MPRTARLVFLVCITLSLLTTAASFAAEPINIGSRLELLVDELDPEVGVRAVVDLIAGEGVERVGSGESTRQKVSW